MTTRLSKIDPLSAGKIIAAVYLGLSLVFVPFFLLFALVAPSLPNRGDGPNPLAAVAGMGILFVVIIPIFYTLLGFIFGLILAVIYNVAAKLTGGLELTFTEVAPVLPPSYGTPLPPR